MTRYISKGEFWFLAELVTDLDSRTLLRASRVDLADSALHAPSVGSGDVDFYPDLYEKAAVLTCRIAWNHPLPDGNKRVAWACLVMFVDMNHGKWIPDPPDPDEAVDAMFRIAAKTVDEKWFTNWLRRRVQFDE